MKSKDPGTLDLWELIHLFRNYVGTIFLCLLLSFGGAYFYLHETPPVYTSSVLLEIAPDTRQQEPNTSIPNLDTSNVLRTINLKIASQSVLLRVIKTNNLAEDPDFISLDKGNFFTRTLPAFLRRIKADRFIDLGSWGTPEHRENRSPSEVELVHALARKVSVDLVRGTRLITVAVSDRDPIRAQRLAQSLVDEFFKESWAERSGNLESARELLLAEVTRDSEALRTSEEKLEEYRKKYNAVSLEAQQNIVVDRLRDLNRQVSEAQNTSLALQPDAERARLMADSDPDQFLSIRSIAELPEIVELRKQTVLQEAQVAMLSKRYGPSHPTMVQAQSQLQELRTSLHSSLRKASHRMVQSYESAKATEKSLRDALAEQEQISMELGRIAIPYHALEREVQANASMYEKVLNSLKQLDARHSLLTINDVDGVDVRIVEKPLVPNQPSHPRPKLTLALAGVIGLFFGCSLALIFRALDNTMSSVDATESFLGLSVLTSIPRSRHRRLTAKPVVIEHPASAEAESFRSLRTSLSLLPGQDEKKCILFTSAVPDEGKSYCSFNTAAAFAQQGFQTLLIDGDFRRPSMQQLLVGWNEYPGLTDCLQQPDLFQSAVLQTPVENLFCLGDRTRHPQGPEWLGRVGLDEILKRAEPFFERIVIDSAPLMAVSDTLSIAKNASIICLVVHAGHTPRRLVKRAVKMLDEVANRTATGVILNKASRQTAAEHYYYYSSPAKHSPAPK